MKESEDKYMNEFIAKVMKHSDVEKPSIDFTSMVMGTVETIKTSASTTYEPLISKRAWLLIFSISSVFVAAVMWFGVTDYSGWLHTMDFSLVDSLDLSKLFNGIQLSNTMCVSILMFAVMLLIQIPLLKNYFDKRIEL